MGVREEPEPLQRECVRTLARHSRRAGGRSFTLPVIRVTIATVQRQRRGIRGKAEADALVQPCSRGL
jgi:hypothetical protein